MSLSATPSAFSLAMIADCLLLTSLTTWPTLAPTASTPTVKRAISGVADERPSPPTLSTFCTGVACCCGNAAGLNGLLPAGCAFTTGAPTLGAWLTQTCATSHAPSITTTATSAPLRKVVRLDTEHLRKGDMLPDRRRCAGRCSFVKGLDA